jgi:hypothetical protein
MTEVHKLINKCDKFMLTYHKTKYHEWYRIELTLRHRFWTEDTLMQEYNDFFGERSLSAGWNYIDIEEAKSKYTWAVLKWNNDET